jgi:putative ABC transport system substrate-binding protein
MKRREFITLMGSAAAWPHGARAQPAEQKRRIGVLMSDKETDPAAQTYARVFQQGLQERGWANGHNAQIEYRWGAANLDRIRAYAAELVALKPDVILAQTALAVTPLQQQSSSIPIVFMLIVDPVESGFVASLARPGGNMTGFTPFEASIATKWLKLLKEIAPAISRVGVVFNPVQAPQVVMLRQIETVARSAGVLLVPLAVSNTAEIEGAVDAFAREANSGMIVLPNPATITNRERIIALAARYRLPAVYPYRYFVRDGGLASYGSDFADQYRRAAGYVDRILRGEKPADLPVQAPTKYELVINLKTAKALGLTVPQTLLATADEVIE